MKAYRIEKWKSVKKGELYQSDNFFIKWYFNKRLDVALKISDISKKDVVLDIGAQEGFFVPSLVLHGNRVYACDINTIPIREEDTTREDWGQGKTLLGLGKELLTTELGEGALEKVLFFYADAGHMPLQNESVDIVFMLDCVEHMPYPTNKLAISEAWRVLKEGGVFVCSCPIEKGPILCLREIIRRILRYPGPRYSLKELIRALIYNETIGEWNGSHEGFDFTHELRRIKDLFGYIYIYRGCLFHSSAI